MGVSKKRAAGEVPANPAPAPAPAVQGLDLLGFHLDGVSWESLESEHPALAGAVADVVREGYTPGQIRQYVMQRGLPVEWARWLEQAARFLLALDPQGKGA